MYEYMGSLQHLMCYCFFISVNESRFVSVFDVLSPLQLIHHLLVHGE